MAVASLAHVAIGMAAGRLWAGRRAGWVMAGFAAASMLPDADVIAFALGIPYEAPFGHRGASHSLAFALACGLAAALPAGRRRWARGALVAAVVASHPLLDAMTTGGLGVALWWPASDARIFFPWRPIPVAPIGAAFLSARGLSVLLWELAPSAPLLLYALWPTRRPR